MLFAAAEWAAETGVPELVRSVGVGCIGKRRTAELTAQDVFVVSVRIWCSLPSLWYQEASIHLRNYR